jgi:hypothetical protein
MTKNTKILLGVAAVAGLGYYFYSQANKPKNFSSFVGCPCRGLAEKQPKKLQDAGYEKCKGGQACEKAQQQ